MDWPLARGSAAPWPADPAAAFRRPAVAVLPFAGVGLPPSHAFLADALTEDLITELGRIPGIAVIGRSTMFGYRGPTTDASSVGVELGVHHAVEGSVRLADGAARVNVRLIDTASAAQCWAERITVPAPEWSNVAEELARGIARRLGIALATRAAPADAGRAPAATDLAMRSWLTLFARPQTPASNESAFAFARAALELDRHHPLALTASAYAHYRAAVFGWAEYAMIEGLQRARTDALAAIAGDAQNADAHYVLGQTLNWLGDLDEAVRMHEACLQLNPSHAPAYGALGQLSAFAGRPEATAVQVGMALALSPKEPLRAVWHWSDALAAWFLDDPARALACSRASMQANDAYPNPYFTGAVAAARLGDATLARQWVQRLRNVTRFESVSAIRERFANVSGARQVEAMESALSTMHALGHPAGAPPTKPHTPVFTVRCFGTFELRRDGRTIRWGAKAPRRPLTLLQLLIAEGGRLPMRSASETLWPDLEGDAAAHALATTLYRLRKLLSPEAIASDGEDLVIDREHMEVDALSFGALAVAAVAKAPDEMVDAYRGPFLPEVAAPWAIAARRRHCEAHRHLRGLAGQALEARGEWTRARAAYMRGLAVDPLGETFYQGALRCCAAEGLRSEAAAVYSACRTELADALGVRPSPATEVLFQQILTAR